MKAAQSWGRTPRVNDSRACVDSAGLDAERGRGLMITAALSTRFGSYRVQGNGKVVWALIADRDS